MNGELKIVETKQLKTRISNLVTRNPYEPTSPLHQKRILSCLRDRRVLLMIFGMPIVQVLLFGFALSTEIKNTKIAVFDQDKTQESAQLLEKINQNLYFDIAENIRSDKEFEQVFKTGEKK